VHAEKKKQELCYVKLMQCIFDQYKDSSIAEKYLVSQGSVCIFAINKSSRLTFLNIDGTLPTVFYSSKINFTTREES
jgi:hypothetical protein